MDEIKRIEQLRRELHEHNHRYYVENQPTISDMEFDALMHELQRLETAHPEMADPNSPTQRVGSTWEVSSGRLPIDTLCSHCLTHTTSRRWPNGMTA